MPGLVTRCKSALLQQADKLVFGFNDRKFQMRRRISRALWRSSGSIRALIGKNIFQPASNNHDGKRPISKGDKQMTTEELKHKLITRFREFDNLSAAYFAELTDN